MNKPPSRYEAYNYLANAFNVGTEDKEQLGRVTGIPAPSNHSEQDHVRYVEKAIEWLEALGVEVNIFGISVELTWQTNVMVFDKADFDTVALQPLSSVTKESFFLYKVMERALWSIVRHFPVPQQPMVIEMDQEALDKLKEQLQEGVYVPKDTKGALVFKDEYLNDAYKKVIRSQFGPTSYSLTMPR